MIQFPVSSWKRVRPPLWGQGRRSMMTAAARKARKIRDVPCRSHQEGRTSVKRRVGGSRSSIFMCRVRVGS